MNNIIQFPQTINTLSTGTNTQNDILEFTSMFGFLSHIKSQLEDEDYRDVLCSILDPDIYVGIDEDLKKIVRVFLSKCSFVQDF